MSEDVNQNKHERNQHNAIGNVKDKGRDEEGSASVLSESRKHIEVLLMNPSDGNPKDNLSIISTDHGCLKKFNSCSRWYNRILYIWKCHLKVLDVSKYKIYTVNHGR